ncbi:hypothetical protein H257_14129 [Aphanomyces astaci]|uniref:Uncharacterized protein n=1 Tax=Aphanomyces astaci TaxID=112090 RepID=W4FUY5_APHAT|nr:hypothetical protein H257_14129 [Aphanomyces astaci]ETV70473.1 hypothetical protein H257_14129 [Aphanomyces astaci]|eukprot:XP_009840185.1 hypothetical protein H257_14129 [Aphanomyces astaci]
MVWVYAASFARNEAYWASWASRASSHSLHAHVLCDSSPRSVSISCSNISRSTEGGGSPRSLDVVLLKRDNLVEDNDEVLTHVGKNDVVDDLRSCGLMYSYDAWRSA